MVVLGPPLALAGLELAHPAHVGHDVVGLFFPVAGWWLTLHLIQFVLFGGVGIPVWLLTAGLGGPAVVASRVGVAVFVAGLLLDRRGGEPPADRADDRRRTPGARDAWAAGAASAGRGGRCEVATDRC